MAKVKGDKTFFHGKAESTGVLLVNLGTPDEPTTSAVRKYLAQFLSDTRVVEIPRIAWLPILYGLVLPRRPANSAKNYKKVWTEEGSPLLTISQQQAKQLQQELDARFNGPVHVELAMRYGKPSIEAGLKALQEKGMQRLLVLPLYPQYSATTTATTFDEVARVFKGWRKLPEYRFISSYHDNPEYITSLATNIEAYWKENGNNNFLLMSFHGLPKRNLDLGDPYFCHCHTTGRLLAEKLGLEDDQWLITFQSRFGKAEWLKPYTDQTLKEMPKNDIKSIDVVCPGFPADCLETLEEIAQENCEYFIEAGGESYRYIPALNNDPQHIRALASLVQQHTQGWPETSNGWNQKEIEKKNKLSQKLAKQRGAKL